MYTILDVQQAMAGKCCRMEYPSVFNLNPSASPPPNRGRQRPETPTDVSVPTRGRPHLHNGRQIAR